MLKRFLRKIKELWYGLFYGMKAAEDIVLKPSINELEDIGIHKHAESNRVSDALLRGEVTQAVEELRYRTMKVDREAKMYEYFSPTLAKKHGIKDESKFVKYDDSDGYELITIQPNNREVLDVQTSVFQYTDENLTYKDPIEKKYTIKIERNFFPRYKIEEYTKKLVIKHKKDNTYILDFYVSKYPDDKELKSKGFVREVERMINGGRSSDVFDLMNVEFVTSKAYALPDMVFFRFRTILYRSVHEYDGHYIISFTGILERQEDNIDNFYSKSMDKKYKENKQKEVVYDIMDMAAYREYKCEDCGKIMVYDPIAIENMKLSEGRDIDEENQLTTDVLSYMDAEISKNTVGKVLCKDCLKKYLENEENSL